MTTWVAALGIVLALTLVAPFLRVVRGPTVYDRAVGAGAMGTTTLILLCMVGHLGDRLDMFIDIAIAYAMLNFVATIVVAKYLDTSREGDAP